MSCSDLATVLFFRLIFSRRRFDMAPLFHLLMRVTVMGCQSHIPTMRYFAKRFPILVTRQGSFVRCFHRESSRPSNGIRSGFTTAITSMNPSKARARICCTVQSFRVVLLPFTSYSSTKARRTLDGLRLLAYMVRIDSVARRTPRRKAVFAILPVVLSHAEGGWKAPLSFHGLIDFPPGPLPELEVYSPQFSYIVDDLSSQSDEQLMARTLEAMGMLTLLMLRHARDEQGISTLLEGWREHSAIWRAEDKEA